MTVQIYNNFVANILSSFAFSPSTAAPQPWLSPISCPRHVCPERSCEWSREKATIMMCLCRALTRFLSHSLGGYFTPRHMPKTPPSHLCPRHLGLFSHFPEKTKPLHPSASKSSGLQGCPLVLLPTTEEGPFFHHSQFLCFLTPGSHKKHQ